ATRTTGDVTAVTNLFRSTGPAVVAAVLELAVLVAAAIIISPTLALLLVLTLPLVAWAARRYAIRSREPFEAERGALSELVHETVATEMGARTVAAHDLAEERIALSDDAAESVYQNRRAILRLQTWILPVLDLASVGPAALIILVGGLRSEEHTSELQSRFDLVCRLLREKKEPQPKRCCCFSWLGRQSQACLKCSTIARASLALMPSTPASSSAPAARMPTRPPKA